MDYTINDFEKQYLTKKYFEKCCFFLKKSMFLKKWAYSFSYFSQKTPYAHKMLYQRNTKGWMALEDRRFEISQNILSDSEKVFPH
jgi:hypothetical protein